MVTQEGKVPMTMKEVEVSMATWKGEVAMTMKEGEVAMEQRKGRYLGQCMQGQYLLHCRRGRYKGYGTKEGEGPTVTGWGGTYRVGGNCKKVVDPKILLLCAITTPAPSVTFLKCWYSSSL